MVTFVSSSLSLFLILFYCGNLQRHFLNIRGIKASPSPPPNYLEGTIPPVSVSFRPMPVPITTSNTTVGLLLGELTTILQLLPARRYASAGLCDSDVSVCLSVRLSVCLSHAGIVPNRIVKCTPSDSPMTLVSGKV